MTTNIYKKINKTYEIFSNANINNDNYFINTKLELYKLVLKIIEYYDNDENKFKNFYMTSLSNIRLKQTYGTILLYPYREVNFNSFDNVNDFIDKICSSVDSQNFYKEVIEILEIKINIIFFNDNNNNDKIKRRKTNN